MRTGRARTRLATAWASCAGRQILGARTEMADFPARALYFMVKPPIELAEHIWRLPRTDKGRAPSLLHVTVLPLVDLALFPPEFVPLLRYLMRDFEAEAFELAFDRIKEGKCVVLSGGDVRGVRRLQKKLVGLLEARDFTFFERAPAPHLTLRYRKDGRGNEEVEPIRWLADELLLIESVVGQQRHEPLGRWQLRYQPDIPDLF